jgi:hypothetical protein
MLASRGLCWQLTGRCPNSSKFCNYLFLVLPAEPAPLGFDHAGASRVLLGAQQILRQLQACTTAAAAADQAALTASIDEASSTSASTVDELDEAESSIAEDDDDVDGDDSLSVTSTVTSSSTNAGNAAEVRQLSHADPGFAASWQDQLRKPGLLGALVAAAYPDRIAQLKPSSGGKPSYTLSTGVATFAVCGVPVGCAAGLWARLLLMQIDGNQGIDSCPVSLLCLPISAAANNTHWLRRAAAYPCLRCVVWCAGRVVMLPSSDDPLAGQQYIAAAELQAGRDGRNDRVMLGAALTQAAIQAYLKDEVQVRRGGGGGLPAVELLPSKSWATQCFESC